MGNKYQYNRKTRQAIAIYKAQHGLPNTWTIPIPKNPAVDLISELNSDHRRELTTLNKLYPLLSRVYSC
jgi:hypothetical protein